MDTTDKLKAALHYLDRGFSVIPANRDKTPLIKWEPYQRQRATETEVKTWWTKYPDAMIGIVTGTISNLAVIDIDTDEGKEAIQEYIPDSLLMPIAETPKGGQHLYFKCPDPPLSNNTRIIPGCDLRGEGGYVIAPPSVNGDGKGYSWLPGLSIDEVAPPPLPSTYISFIKEFAFKGYKAGRNTDCNGITERYEALQNVTISLDEGCRDESIFHVANCLIKGGMTEGNARYILGILADSCNPSFPEKEVLIKIQSAIQRAKQRERNFTDEIKNWIDVTDGYWNVTECFKALQIITKEEKTAGRVAIHRLRSGKNPLIEKHGDKDGCYRRIDNQCEDIDFLSATDTVLPVKWPFEIERYFNTMPKNIIVIAGEPDAGKTAFLLNVARLNMRGHEVIYFSSEMGAQELRGRLSKFDEPLNTWKKLTVKERSSNFADVVKPDAINVVDFLEIHDEFYKIGLYIKEIFDKLNKGIAVIAIQKNKNTEYGLGGGRGLEKARLYLSMESGKVKIIKAKNWVDSANNPNGLEMKFKLVKGCHFIEEGYWKKP
ncbi:MAG: bifunctional DNA primase/polymerase [Syntrophorhabdaceae bacterium]|nr:bifunctional DNA primase/polymerase [Syntrophorhabdaceae bacterium]MDD5243941.1 bifunctional DNA primase/polymerase [Syntrophorhabdaceae bacterium]